MTFLYPHETQNVSGLPWGPSEPMLRLAAPGTMNVAGKCSRICVGPSYADRYCVGCTGMQDVGSSAHEEDELVLTTVVPLRVNAGCEWSCIPTGRSELTAAALRVWECRK